MSCSNLVGRLPNRNTVFGSWNKNPDRHLVRVEPGTNRIVLHAPPAAAAGVLPFCIVDGKIFFLLGREAPRQNFSGAGTWCDFGGGMHGPRNSTEIATQELLEETIGSLIDDPGKLLAHIVDNLKLFVCSNVGKKVPYHMYIVQIPYADIPSVFRWRIRVARKCRNMDDSNGSHERQLLKQMQPAAFQVNGKVRKAWLEKDDVQWVSAEHLNRFPLRWEFSATLVDHDIVRRLRKMIVSPRTPYHKSDVISLSK
tara:strand:- start:808 stop:1569 length:762 start_codon:yes stop_codon:yes gene_type:complete